MPDMNAMACPVDGTTLSMSERQGIEIDYCPTCRGVWLDRGELDKIVARSGAEATAPSPAPVQQPAPPPAAPWGGQQGQGYDRGYGQQGYHGKRKKSFIENLFD